MVPDPADHVGASIVRLQDDHHPAVITLAMEPPENDHYLSAVNHEDELDKSMDPENLRYYVGLCIISIISTQPTYFIIISMRCCDEVEEGPPKKIYADLDAVQGAMAAAEATVVGPTEVELQTSTEVMVPIVTATDDVTGTIMHWEYLDPNTVRTFEIPVSICSNVPSILTEGGYQISPPVPADAFSLPPGFQPHQQYPYVGSGTTPPSAPPPPPPPAASSSTSENHSILIQRVPHRHRKGRGKSGKKTIF